MYDDSVTTSVSGADNKCCEWLNKIINSKFTTLEDKELLINIKQILQEFPKEELEPYRGKYLAFVKDDKNKYQLHENVFNNALEVTDAGIKSAYLFFIPTENEYCATATMPYRNAISKPNKCIIS